MVNMDARAINNFRCVKTMFPAQMEMKYDFRPCDADVTGGNVLHNTAAGL